MICVVNESNVIVNIIKTDTIISPMERKWYPWNELGHVYTNARPLEYAKTFKIEELKRQRDSLEVQPIEYKGNLFDYDAKARDRINGAIVALDLAGENASVLWTTTNDTDATVTADDLRNIIAAVAARSNILHIAYRKAREQAQTANDESELEQIALSV
jgi:hypothetical protein|nr:MAG TPA: protein of unknown function (DUF4376) [Caudoviricetes sp.]